MFLPACTFALLFAIVKASSSSVPYEINYNPDVLGHEDYIRPIHNLIDKYARRHSVGRFDSTAVHEALYYWHFMQAFCVFYTDSIVLSTEKTDLTYWKVQRKTMLNNPPFLETAYYAAPYLFTRLRTPPLSTIVVFSPANRSVKSFSALSHLVGPLPAALPFPASLNFHPAHPRNTTGWPFSAFVKMCVFEAKPVSSLKLPVAHVVRVLQAFFPRSKPRLIYAPSGSTFRWLKRPFESFTSTDLLQTDTEGEAEPPYQGILLVAYVQKYSLRLDYSADKVLIGLALRLSDDCPNISLASYENLSGNATLLPGPVSQSDAIQRYIRMPLKIEPVPYSEIMTIETMGDDKWECAIL